MKSFLNTGIAEDEEHGTRFLADLVAISDKNDFKKIKDRLNLDNNLLNFHNRLFKDLMIILEKEYGYKLTSIESLNNYKD